jgi:hypothetical protein
LDDYVELENGKYIKERRAIYKATYTRQILDMIEKLSSKEKRNC